MKKIVYNGEMDPRLCKEVLGATIAEIVDNDPDTIYLDADLMSCSGTLKWAKKNPERAIDCGIAEANMAGGVQADHPLLRPVRVAPHV